MFSGRSAQVLQVLPGVVVYEVGTAGYDAVCATSNAHATGRLRALWSAVAQVSWMTSQTIIVRPDARTVTPRPKAYCRLQIMSSQLFAFRYNRMLSVGGYLSLKIAEISFLVDALPRPPAR